VLVDIVVVYVAAPENVTADFRILEFWTLYPTTRCEAFSIGVTDVIGNVKKFEIGVALRDRTCPDRVDRVGGPPFKLL